MRVRPWLGAMVAAGVGFAGPGQAFGQSTKPNKPATAVVGAPSPAAISVVLDQLKRGLGRLPPSVTVASSIVQADVKAPRSRALQAELLRLFASSLNGATAFAAANGFAQAVAYAKVRGHAGLLWLRPRIARGQLTVTVEAYAVATTVWARSVRPKPVLQRQVHAQAKLDAQLRSYLTPLRIGSPRIQKFPGADRDLVALACGDVDGDGLSDVVSLSRRRLLVVELDKGRVRRRREARWPSLAGVAPVPLREPMGALSLVARPGEEGMWIDAFLSDRAVSVRLDANLSVVAKTPMRAVPFGAGSACARAPAMLIGPELKPCWGEPAGELARRLPVGADATASARIVNRDGGATTWVAARNTSGLRLQGAAEGYTLGGTGAQIALADLDQDGRPEVVSSRDVKDAGKDALSVRTVARSGLVVPRFTLAAPQGVEAVAVCPVDDAGLAPIVMASAGEFWLLR